MNELMGPEDVRRLAKSMSQSKMFGMSEDQAFSLMMLAQAENIHPAQAMMEYDVIQGKPRMKSTTMLARFQRSGGRVHWKENSPERVEALFEHPEGGSMTVVWDVAKAQRAGLYGRDIWKKYPDAMLRSKAISEGVRAVYPACLAGMYSEVEAYEIDGEPEQKQEGRPAMMKQAEDAEVLSDTDEFEHEWTMWMDRYKKYGMKNASDSDLISRLKKVVNQAGFQSIFAKHNMADLHMLNLKLDLFEKHYGEKDGDIFLSGVALANTLDEVMDAADAKIEDAPSPEVEQELF